MMAAPIGAPTAQAAGTTPLALVPQVDSAGNVAAGCLLYFFQAGTVSTPQNAYSDFGLTQVLPNPAQCDQAGRVPMHWLADGLIHIRLTDSSGVQLVDTTMQVLGPSSGGGGGGGGTVDPTTILSTGDEKVRYGTGSLTGFVRENGLTIGNALSGATERANADTQNLFVYLYTTDPNLVVAPSGRSGNALNDYNAGKTIALPDMRGASNVGLADMGNSPTTLFTQLYAQCNSGVTILGAACGSQQHQLALGELPTGITSSGNNNILVETSGGGAFNFPIANNTLSTTSIQPGSGATPVPTSPGVNWSGTNQLSGNNSIAVTSTNTSGNPHSIVPPIMLKTFYIKL